GSRNVAQRARSAVFSGLADVVLVSGVMTGEAVETSQLRAVKQVVKDTPVSANTGVNLDNIKDILSTADGCVVGTHFKIAGDTWNAVDGARVRRFMDAVGKLRLPMPILLGIDIGTTSTIGILIDTEGRTLATASRPSDLRSLRANW